MQKDTEFHNVILKGCRNERVTRALEDIYDECFFLREKYFNAALRNFSEEDRTQLAFDVLLEHKKILDAIIAGDPDEAERTVRESVRSAHNRMLLRYAASRGTAEVE